MTVLVTGAAGYLGAHVIRALRLKGVKAMGTARVANLGVGYLATDLLNPSSVRRAIDDSRPDCIVHCAAEVPRADLGYSDKQAAARSIEMVRNLLDAIPSQSALLYISSMTVYGTPSEASWTEADAGEPQSEYARGKWRAEQEIAASEARALTIRLPGLFGAPRNAGLVYNLEAAMRAGTEPALPKVPVVWAAMHVGDAAKAVACLARKLSDNSLVFENVGEAVHVACEGPNSIDYLARQLAGHYGRALRYEVKHPVVTFDLSRARSLGIAPLGTLLQSALCVADDSTRH